mmetsp:Transcript_30509/g.61269  ORF Transcript_30509/g.61269 Transcript_30509/m.61269 type:complete len:333 (+) Transcript_30509:127-1125(+)
MKFSSFFLLLLATEAVQGNQISNSDEGRSIRRRRTNRYKDHKLNRNKKEVIEPNVDIGDIMEESDEAGDVILSTEEDETLDDETDVAEMKGPSHQGRGRNGGAEHRGRGRKSGGRKHNRNRGNGEKRARKNGKAHKRRNHPLDMSMAGGKADEHKRNKRNGRGKNRMSNGKADKDEKTKPQLRLSGRNADYEMSMFFPTGKADKQAVTPYPMTEMAEVDFSMATYTGKANKHKTSGMRPYSDMEMIYSSKANKMDYRTGTGNPHRMSGKANKDETPEVTEIDSIEAYAGAGKASKAEDNGIAAQRKKFNWLMEDVEQYEADLYGGKSRKIRQ